MENSRRVVRRLNAGDAAVEGLLNGILAGVAMALLLVLVQAAGGVAPLAVLSYFDLGENASPFVGAFTHIAVSGIYGVIFGMVAAILARAIGERMSLAVWLLLGLGYGLLVFGVAEWIVLPRTLSPLRELPPWLFASAHVLYGLVLGLLAGRSRKE